jgi:hypothetical protein
MQRVTRSSGVATMPAAPASPAAPGFFTGGNPGAGQQATVPGFEWFNGVQEELIGMLVRAGVTPAQADLTQLRQSLDRLYGGGLTVLSANSTLTVDNAGDILVSASGGARTITLPAANALGGRPIKMRFTKTDNTANIVTVARAGADTIQGAASEVLRYQWDSLTLISDGVSGWIVSAGGAGARNLADPGWVRLPGGIIIQWGKTGVVAPPESGIYATATFPIAFPNQVLSLQGTAEIVSGQGSYVLFDSQHTLSGCTFGIDDTINDANSMRVRYLAIGW